MQNNCCPISVDTELIWHKTTTYCYISSGRTACHIHSHTTLPDCACSGRLSLVAARHS